MTPSLTLTDVFEKITHWIPRKDNTIQTLTLPINQDDIPITALDNVENEFKLFWKDRFTKRPCFAIGHSLNWSGDTVSEYKQSWEIASKLCKEHPEIQAFIAKSFHDHPLKRPWDTVPNWQITVPKIRIHNQTLTLILNNKIPEQWPQKIQETIDQIRQLLSHQTETASPIITTSKRQIPTCTEWKKMIRFAKSKIEQDAFQKVVCAREVRTQQKHPSSLFQILSHLPDQEDACCRFGIQLDKDRGFFGKTPEYLINITDNKVQTEAIAGTQLRGKTEEEDTQYKQKLQNNKETKEHNLVVDHIHPILQKYCGSPPTVHPKEILQLHQVQHLHQRLTGTLHNKSELFSLIQELHPTPAVSGLPQKEAHDYLSVTESFERGWYSGYLGWMSQDSVSLVVAIRSAFCHQDQISIYSGAGITEQSNAEEEWHELNHKIQPLLDLLNT